MFDTDLFNEIIDALNTNDRQFQLTMAGYVWISSIEIKAIATLNNDAVVDLNAALAPIGYIAELRVLYDSKNVYGLRIKRS